MKKTFTPAEKISILHNLQIVATANLNNPWGLCMQIFIDDSHKLGDADYALLLKTIHEQISDAPTSMKEVLGEQFDFFRSFNLYEPVKQVA